MTGWASADQKNTKAKRLACIGEESHCSGHRLVDALLHRPSRVDARNYFRNLLLDAQLEIGIAHWGQFRDLPRSFATKWLGRTFDGHVLRDDALL